MRIRLTGRTGGIGSAIEEMVGEENITRERSDLDWLILAHGTIDENNPQKVISVNTTLCIEEALEALPYLRKGIIFISSTSAMTANRNFPVYSASKAALNTFTLALAKAHPEKQFYALCPGRTETKMWQSLKLDGKTQSPEAVARVVKDIIDGKYLENRIITVRDGIVTV